MVSFSNDNQSDNYCDAWTTSRIGSYSGTRRQFKTVCCKCRPHRRLQKSLKTRMASGNLNRAPPPSRALLIKHILTTLGVREGCTIEGNILLRQCKRKGEDFFGVWLPPPRLGTSYRTLLPSSAHNNNKRVPTAVPMNSTPTHTAGRQLSLSTQYICYINPTDVGKRDP